jgi:hypothetical protein
LKPTWKLFRSGKPLALGQKNYPGGPGKIYFDLPRPVKAKQNSVVGQFGSTVAGVGPGERDFGNPASQYVQSFGKNNIGGIYSDVRHVCSFSGCGTSVRSFGSI